MVCRPVMPGMCPVCGDPLGHPRGAGQSRRNLGVFGIPDPGKECSGRDLVMTTPARTARAAAALVMYSQVL